MIVTVTLNPAVDRICTLEYMYKGQSNLLQEIQDVPGGKGVNVAKVLRQFHLPVTCLGFLGGYSGKMIEEEVTKLGADCRFTKIKGNTRTNLCILEAEGRATQLMDPGYRVTEEELENWKKEFQNTLQDCELIAFCGSVPKGVPTDIYFHLISLCKKLGIKTVLDTSGEALKEGVEAKPDMIKPNREELEALVGYKLSTREMVVKEAKRMVSSGIGKVIVSLGEEGMLYCDKDITIYEKARDVSVVNTLGCGDSAVASLIMSELNEDAPIDSIKKAVALSAANATTPESAVIPMDTYLNLL